MAFIDEVILKENSGTQKVDFSLLTDKQKKKIKKLYEDAEDTDDMDDIPM
jgi:hypothetical protein